MTYYQACSTFYHQGSDLCNDHEPFFKALADDVRINNTKCNGNQCTVSYFCMYLQINEMRTESKQLEKTMQNRHMSVSAFVDDQTFAGGGADQHNRIDAADASHSSSHHHHHVSMASSSTSAAITSAMEGYLFKRTSKGFKTWNRRWFYLFDNKLMYRKRGNGEPASVMEEDLRICTVRPANDSDRRFCFEVISPTKSHILQADSAEMLSTWMMALHRSIGAAIQQQCDGDNGGATDAVSAAMAPYSCLDGGSSSSRTAGGFKKM